MQGRGVPGKRFAKPGLRANCRGSPFRRRIRHVNRGYCIIAGGARVLNLDCR